MSHDVTVSFKGHMTAPRGTKKSFLSLHEAHRRLLDVVVVVVEVIAVVTAIVVVVVVFVVYLLMQLPLPFSGAAAPQLYTAPIPLSSSPYF